MSKQKTIEQLDQQIKELQKKKRETKKADYEKKIKELGKIVLKCYPDVDLKTFEADFKNFKSYVKAENTLKQEEFKKNFDRSIIEEKDPFKID